MGRTSNSELYTRVMAAFWLLQLHDRGGNWRDKRTGEMSTVHFVIETEDDMKVFYCSTQQNVTCTCTEAYHYTWCIVAVHERTSTKDRKYRDLYYHFNMLLSSQSVPINLRVTACVLLCSCFSLMTYKTMSLQPTVKNSNQHQSKMITVISHSTTKLIFFCVHSV